MATQYMRTLFGADLFGFGGDTTDLTAAIDHDLWRLEVRNGDDERLAVLPYWGSAQWQRTLNEPSALDVTYPYDDAAVDYLTYPNLI